MEIENSSPLELVKFPLLEMELLITRVKLALELKSLRLVGDDPT